MNQEDIIAMAREAGAMPYTNRHYPDRPAHAFGIEQLERFAALVAQRVLAGSYPEMIAIVAAAEREHGQKWFDAVTAQHKQEILAEREACAKVCEENWRYTANASEMAEYIRARSNT